MAASRINLLTTLTIIVLLTVARLDATVAAQADSGNWSPPAKLLVSSGTIVEPNLATDRTGILHAFWAYDEHTGSMEIFYARWDGTQWSQPVDIVAMSGNIYAPRAVVDEYGRIHLIWHGPGNTLFYSMAEVDEATTAVGWSSPEPLGQANPHSDIAIDDAGILYIVYPQLLEAGVSYIWSKDRGENWSAPVHIAEPVTADATTEFTRLSITAKGNMHVVWTELTLPQGYPPLGVFYSRSMDGGRNWSTPVELAGADYMEVGVLSTEDDNIYTAWNGRAGISGRYYRWSQDSGQTWSKVGILTPPEMGGGSTNPPELAVDSEGTVHIILNTSPGNIAGNDATMYTYGRYGQWMPVVDISHRVPDYVGLTNEASAFTIAQGNILHVLFVDSDATRLWHTWRTSPAPAVAPAAFLRAPTRSPESPQGESERSTRSGETKASRVSPIVGAGLDSATSDTGSQSNVMNPEMTLVVSVLPAFILVIGTVLIALYKKGGR